MKKGIAVLFSFVVILSLVGTVFAAPPGPGWYTGITLQNVTTDTSRDADIFITAYGASSEASYNTTLAAGASKSILPTDFVGMGAGFQGGAIVQSSHDLRSIVNITNRYLSGSGLGDAAATHPAAAQYQGMSAPNTTLVFPLAKNNNYGKTTTFYIQNAGSGAATARATFIFGGKQYIYNTPSLTVGKTAVFTPELARDASNNPPPSGNNAGSIGSLTVTSAQAIAGVFLEHRTSEPNATLLQATRAFTMDDADTVLFSPTNKDNFFNRFTGLQVQNVGPGAVNVRVTYTTTQDGNCTAKGQTGSETVNNLAEGASTTFASASIPGNNCLASARVEVISGSGKIVGVVNESFTSAYMSQPGRIQESVTSFAFPQKSVTTKVSVPVYKEDSFNKGTGVTIQNVGGGDASVVIVLTSAAGRFETNPITIPQGASRAFSDMRNMSGISWKGTALTPSALGCSAGNNVCGINGSMGMMITSNVGIVAIANESTYPFTTPRILQDKNNFEGFNLP